MILELVVFSSQLCQYRDECHSFFTYSRAAAVIGSIIWSTFFCDWKWRFEDSEQDRVCFGVHFTVIVPLSLCINHEWNESYCTSCMVQRRQSKTKSSSHYFHLLWCHHHHCFITIRFPFYLYSKIESSKSRIRIQNQAKSIHSILLQLQARTTYLIYVVVSHPTAARRRRDKDR